MLPQLNAPTKHYNSYLMLQSITAPTFCSDGELGNYASFMGDMCNRQSPWFPVWRMVCFLFCLHAVRSIGIPRYGVSVLFGLYSMLRKNRSL